MEHFLTNIQSTAMRAGLLVLILSTSAGTVFSQTERRSAPPAVMSDASPQGTNVRHPSPPTEVEKERKAQYGDLPILFTPNEGQLDPAVMFTAAGSGFRLLFTKNTTFIKLSRRVSGNKNAGRTEGGTIAMRMVGAAVKTPVVGELPQAARTSYFIGNDVKKHVTNLPNYGRIRYTGVYPGVDLVYYGKQGEIEYDFIVAPSADAKQIAIAFDGVEKMSLDPEGNLMLRTSFGNIVQQKPYIYQDIGGERVKVSGNYILRAGNAIGFVVGTYNTNLPLIIDPVLSYSTFLGGSGNDYGTAIAVDGSGNAYITGYTVSTNFPVSSTGFQRTLGRSATNIFVTKLNPAGNAVVYSTYIGGGSEIDFASGIAVDSTGSAHVTGTTSSSTFPTTTTAYQKGVTGGSSFVTKLAAAGNALLYSTYLQKASAKAIALDSSGLAYVTGTAISGFVTTTNAFQKTTRSVGSTNAFTLKLNASGSSATYSTFVGGTGTDAARGIAVGPDGSAHIAGSTTSPDFPGALAFQAAKAGMQDGFVTKLTPAGDGIVYSTFLGGEKDDVINAIALDLAGNAYVGGETYSWTFPVTSFALKSGKGGFSILNSNVSQGSGFVSKLTADGSALAYSTYLGGEYCYPSQCTLFNPPAQLPSEAVYGIAVDTGGHALVTGIAAAPRFPLVDSLITADLQPNAQQSAMFATKLSQGGDFALYSTFVRTGTANAAATPAGARRDAGQGISVDAAGNAYGVGESLAGFATTAGTLRTVNAGGTDAVIFKLSGSTANISLSSSAQTLLAGQPWTLTATVADPGATGTVSFRIYYGTSGTTVIKTAPLVDGLATVSASAVAGIVAVNAIYRNNSINLADSGLLFVAINPPEECE